MHAVIGDVSGHGATEAAVGVCLRVAWRCLVLAGMAAHQTIELVEQMLVAEREGDHIFATLTHLVYAPDRRSVQVLRGRASGLPLRTAGRVELVSGGGRPGAGAGALGLSWEQQELGAVPDGASLVLFTDGLFEGRTGPGSERLGEEGLVVIAEELNALLSVDFVGLHHRADRGRRQPVRRARGRRRRRPSALGGPRVTTAEPQLPRFPRMTVRGWFRLVFAVMRRAADRGVHHPFYALLDLRPLGIPAA